MASEKARLVAMAQRIHERFDEKQDAGSYVENNSPATFAGISLRQNYNPGNLASWTGSAAYSLEGLSVDFGGYGPRAFGPAGTPSALNGSMNIPATSTIVNHASGLSGYAKSASVTTGGVAIYGEANRQASNALVWGLNTRTQDGGFGGLNVWGYENDLNIDNVTTTAIGFDAVGASTVEPTVSIAYQVQAIGVFASPKKRWQYAFRSRDAAAIVGLELGAVAEGNNVGSQPIQLLFRNASGVPTQGFSAQVDSAGNALLAGGTGSTLFALRTPTSTGHNIQMLGDNIGFFGTAPAVKPVMTNAQSIATALSNLGLATDSTGGTLGDAAFGNVQASSLKVAAATPTVGAGLLGIGTTTATSATAGSSGDVPAQVLGYLVMNLGGTAIKVPYYAA